MSISSPSSAFRNLWILPTVSAKARSGFWSTSTFGSRILHEIRGWAPWVWRGPRPSRTGVRCTDQWRESGGEVADNRNREFPRLRSALGGVTGVVCSDRPRSEEDLVESQLHTKGMQTPPEIRNQSQRKFGSSGSETDQAHVGR